MVSIAKTGDAVAGAPLTTGNSTQIYCNGDEAYPAMLAALDSAKKSIALQSYIFRADAIGTEFASRLISAKNRGVEVRVLVDGIGSGYFNSPIIDILQTGGVTAERFLHEIRPWKMSFINLRNHKKRLVVDGKIGFTGGLNIEDENIGGDHLPEVQDVHFQLEGPVVHQLLTSFALDWKFCTSEILLGETWWPKVVSTGNLIMRGISAGPNESARIIETIMAAAVEQAQIGVRIVTPYFLPEDPFFEVIRRASLRGVKVEVVMPRKTDHFFFDWAIAAHLATFYVGSGCKVCGVGINGCGILTKNLSRSMVKSSVSIKPIETFVTKKRNRLAAPKFMRKAMKGYGRPMVIVTDRLRSYGVAMKVIGNADCQETGAG